MCSQQFAGIDKAATEKQLADLSSHYDKLAKTASAPEPTEIAERIRAIQIQMEKLRAEVYLPKYTKQIAEATVQLQNLAERYQYESKQKELFAAGTACPTCRRMVTNDNLPEVVEALQKNMDNFYTKGTEKRIQLHELKNLEHQGAADFIKAQEENILSCEAELTQLLTQQAESKKQNIIWIYSAILHWIVCSSKCRTWPLCWSMGICLRRSIAA